MRYELVDADGQPARQGVTISYPLLDDVLPRHDGDGIRHVHLPNGYVCSVLRTSFGWEAWAWRDGARLTSAPVCFDNEYECWGYVTGVESLS